MNIDAIVAEAMKDSNFAKTLKAKLIEAEKAKEWPKIGSPFCFVNTLFQVCYRSNFSPQDPEHVTYAETGNCFRTLAEGEYAAKCAKYRAMYRAMGRPFLNRGTNWSVWYDIPSDSFMFQNDLEAIGESTYFSTKEDCKKAIDSIGRENFIHYVLGID